MYCELWITVILISDKEMETQKLNKLPQVT